MHPNCKEAALKSVFSMTENSGNPTAVPAAAAPTEAGPSAATDLCDLAWVRLEVWAQGCRIPTLRCLQVYRRPAGVTLKGLYWEPQAGNPKPGTPRI